MPEFINPRAVAPSSIVVFGRWLGFNYYPWQVQALVAMASGYNTAIVTCNGSGKTSVLIPSFTLWLLYTFPTARCPITSGSWLQVEKQIFGNIRKFAAHPAFKGWTFNDSEIRTPQNGYAQAISTSEPERLEGWHTDPGSPLAYIVDEAKTFDDVKFSGIDRCITDFRVLLSTAGPCTGKFYRAFSSELSQWWTLRVPSSLCPHIPQQKVEQDRANYRHIPSKFASMHEAEFSDDEGQLIIPPGMLRHAIEHPPAFVDGPQVAFCDFAAGGDQNVCAVRRGNRVTVEAKWKETNTLQACRRFIDIFERLRLKPYQVYCDGSGMGVTMCDALDEEFGQVHRVLNGSSAEDDAYSNRGSEMWFTAKRAIEDGHIILPGDPEFFAEATDRQIHYDNGQYLLAEPKKVMKKRGVHSPDVADAVLAAIACGPQNFVISPKAQARKARELRHATQTMAAYRSAFHVPFINF